jgi:hypothetical protein
MRREVARSSVIVNRALEGYISFALLDNHDPQYTNHEIAQFFWNAEFGMRCAEWREQNFKREVKK